MNNLIHGFVIDTKQAIRDENNNIIISYADLTFSGKPIVLVTPYTNQNDLKYIPTVIRVGDTHISIRDENSLNPQNGNYYLNVLLVDPNPNSFQDAMLYPLLKPKVESGMLSIDVTETNNIGFLTPFWTRGLSVGSVESINKESRDSNAALETIYASSLNYAPDYAVNYLSIRPRSDYKLLSSGTLTKPKEELTINLPNPWDRLPCVIVTPVPDGLNTVAQHLEFVKDVQLDHFTVASKNASFRHKINWMAVPQDVSRPNKEYALDSSFDHFTGHFPDHKTHIDKFRQELENIILTGAEPSAELRAKTFDFVPQYTTTTSRTRTAPGEEAVAIAKVVFDAIALVISITIAVNIKINQEARDAIALELQAALENGELQALTDSANRVGSLYGGYPEALGLDELENVAKTLKNLSGAMFSAGLLKTFLVVIYEQLDLPWWKWVTIGVTLAAQITALVASEGLVTLAWIARLIGILGTATTLGEDAYALHQLNQSNSNR